MLDGCTMCAMLEPLDSYYARFWKRFFSDATPWARDNIVWDVIVLVVPPFAAYLRDRHTQINWALIREALWLYAFAAAIYILVHLCRTPKKLDLERDAREIAFLDDILGRDQMIKEREETIRTLREKPKRSAAEQHDYDKLKKALGMFKETGLIALRYIRSVGSITFGGAYSPTLPSGLTPEKALWVYRHCASEGLLNCTANFGKTQEIFAVLPKMDKIFNDVLFPELERPENHTPHP